METNERSHDTSPYEVIEYSLAQVIPGPSYKHDFQEMLLVERVTKFGKIL